MSRPMIVVTEITPATLSPALLAIWRDSTGATHHFVSHQHLDEIHALLETLLPACVPMFVTRGEDGHPCAFMHASEGELHMLFVADRYRGKGHGSALVDHAIRHLGVTRVTVNEQNAEATAFYRARGFVVTDRQALDDQGRPYPVLRMALADPA
ncbi:GNAT family N-acetyltransferase [Uliginosibacterium sp. H1]|uniref:GNAT family N-acetyltransferase n=1 Tax=Uliginosibacterium sp. H1 TaxID=3114757 RepID=UPI002E176112|nr:GNAT family N-acetyltransferase [Uliginosibacterium sp. H1]